MKFINSYKYTILFLFILFFNLKSTKAQLPRAQIISGYIYNFGNNIEWTNNNFTEFNIVLISSNAEIINEFKKMELDQKIHDKKISLSILSQPNSSIQNAQLIFISKDKLSYYMNVFDRIEGKQILLVSENYNNKSYVMLNLFDTKNKKLLFEINKPNIINQKLRISDKMLLLGGTEIDVAQIYLKSQHSLRFMELQMNTYVKKLDSLEQNIVKSNLQVKKQKNLILKQKTEIEKQRVLQENQLEKIIEYKDTISQQLSLLQADKTKLIAMTKNLLENKVKLDSQYKKIEESNRIHDMQISKIDSINNEIDKRNLILSDKERIIGKQKNRMNFLGIISIFILLIIFIVILAYIQNKRKSKKLYSQKLEIDRINNELNKNNRELKNSLEEIKQIQKQLIQSEKMASLGILSAGIAHELNNPINFIFAGINSLLKDFEDLKPIITEISKINPETKNLNEKLKNIEKLKKDYYFAEAFEAIPLIIDDIKLGAERTSEIINGLRSFSRTDKGELKHIDIHKGIETSLLLLRNKYKNRIEIIKKFDSKITKFKCYPIKINQMILNLISNAIDAIEDKGKIWITTKKENENIIISVEDNGCGISDENQKNLFDPFFTTKPVGQGTGLGLSITYGIVEEHHGKIKFESTPEKGSKFIITLPIIK